MEDTLVLITAIMAGNGYIDDVMQMTQVSWAFWKEDMIWDAIKDWQSNTGRTRFMYACATGNIDLVNYLLKRSAKINIVDYFGGTALSYACKNSHSHIVRLLLSLGATITKPNGSIALSTLEYACRNKDIELIRLLIKHGADPNEEDIGITLLMAMAHSGNIIAVNELLAHGADPTRRKNNLNAIHFARMNRETKVIKILENHIAEMVS